MEERAANRIGGPFNIFPDMRRNEVHQPFDDAHRRRRRRCTGHVYLWPYYQRVFVARLTQMPIERTMPFERFGFVRRYYEFRRLSDPQGRD